jgi:hypothetical protein
MSLTKATYSMIVGAPVNVDDYIPAGTNTATTDCASYINDALTAGAGKTVVFGQGVTYRVNSTITIKGDGTKILGRGATLNSYAAVSGITYQLVGGTRYPYNINVEDLNLNAYGVGAYAWRVLTSYSTYRRCSIGIPAVNTSGRGFALIGDETNGTGPYYNTFIDCDAQSGSAGLDHIGFSFITSAPSFNRGPNANTFIGCRAGSCLSNWVINGNGNTFVNPIAESPAGTGTAFAFQATTPTSCAQNTIYGAYLEAPLNGFTFNADTQSNSVFGAYGTGVTNWKTDLGTGNQVLTAIGAWDMPTGLRFPSAAITDPNTLDAYAERDWTPVPTSLTVVGTPTYTGRYIKIGKQVFWTLKIESTTTTASTANTTYFSGLPAAASPAVCAAVSSNVASFGNGYVDTTGNVYTPTWGATPVVFCSGSYEAAS